MLQFKWLLCSLFSSVLSQDISFEEDIKALSELSLEKLLHLKKSFDFDDDVPETSLNSTTQLPQALALQSKKISKEREVYHYDEPPPTKDKSSSIQSIFQISITTLAFLAFGGYLICLLVQAVKGKSNNYQTTATQIMSALVSANIKRRRRPTRQPYRFQKKPTTGYRRGRPRPKREVLNELNVENMYYTLINLSEGYTRYHTEDYLRYNFSSNYF